MAVIDRNSKAAITIDLAHARIHDGTHFHAGSIVTLADTAAYYVSIQTPNTTVYSHFQWKAGSSGITVAHLYRSPAALGMTGGSAVTALNSNENKSTVFGGLSITADVGAPTTTGTQVDIGSWGADGQFTKFGGGSSRDDEIELKANTLYCLAFSSGSADNIVQYGFSWYEI